MSVLPDAPDEAADDGGGVKNGCSAALFWGGIGLIVVIGLTAIATNVLRNEVAEETEIVDPADGPAAAPLDD